MISPFLGVDMSAFVILCIIGLKHMHLEVKCSKVGLPVSLSISMNLMYVCIFSPVLWDAYGTGRTSIRGFLLCFLFLIQR